MNVQQLIEALSKFDPSAKVSVIVGDAVTDEFFVEGREGQVNLVNHDLADSED